MKNRCYAVRSKSSAPDHPPTTEECVHHYLALYGKPTSVDFIPQDHEHRTNKVGTAICCGPHAEKS